MGKTNKFSDTINGFFYGIAMAVIAGIIVYAVTGKQTPTIDQSADIGNVNSGYVDFKPEAQIGDKTLNLRSSSSVSPVDSDLIMYLELYKTYEKFSADYERILIGNYGKDEQTIEINRNDLKLLTEAKRHLDKIHKEIKPKINEINAAVDAANKLEKGLRSNTK
jgi:hypothetical protein